jgi:uncharacterized Zn finger protein
MEVAAVKEIQVSAKSSSGGSYKVTFTLKGDELSIKCSCMAGQMGQNCKHVYGLVIGDDAMLYDFREKDRLPEIADMVNKSNLMPTLNELNYELARVEQKMEELLRKKKAIKNKIALAITKGATRSGA